MNNLLCICILANLICKLIALPVNSHHSDDHLNFNQPAYQSGLIKDYNSQQKFAFKFTDLRVVRSSPNQHQSLPLTINELSDQFDDQMNKNQFTNSQQFVDNSLSDESRNKNLIEDKISFDRSFNVPSAVLSALSTRVNKRIIKRKDKLRSSIRKQQIRPLYEHHEQHEICPESSYTRNDLDPVSKAYLSPILFSGKLSSLSEDYTGRVAATFQVLRVIKTTTVSVKDESGQIHQVPIQLAKGHQVVLHFVSKPGQRYIPPHCAVFMNSSSIGSLRLEQKYIVYAAAPVQSLQEMHRHSFGSVSYRAEMKEEIINSTGDFTNLNNSTTITNLNGNLSAFLNESSNYSTDLQNNQTTIQKTVKSFKFQNSVWMNDQSYPLPMKSAEQNSTETVEQTQIPMQFIIHYLSAFAPEPFSKNISKSITKTLSMKTMKPQVEGLTGDVRVQAKNKLRLRCKISGNPQPWVDWFRNGKKLRNKGRISIKNTKKYSKLEISRVESSDSGYYECRVQNVVSKPVASKTRVIVFLNRRKPTKRPEEQTTTTTAVNLWPLMGQPCPINNFCLNGGVCTFFENVFEYVCQCLDGYQGQRCQEKDIHEFKICAPGYRGLRCQEKDISLDEPHMKSVMDGFNSANKK